MTTLPQGGGLRLRTPVFEWAKPIAYLLDTGGRRLAVKGTLDCGDRARGWEGSSPGSASRCGDSGGQCLYLSPILRLGEREDARQFERVSQQAGSIQQQKVRSANRSAGTAAHDRDPCS